MQKRYYLVIFFGFYLILLFLFRTSLINEYNYAQIQKAPAKTAVTDTKLIIKREGSDFEGDWVKFYYTVDGKNYDFKSLNTTRSIANAYMTKDKYDTITYDARAPQRAMLTYHYELRQKENKSGRMTKVILISLAIFAFILTLLVALVMFVISRGKNKKVKGAQA